VPQPWYTCQLSNVMSESFVMACPELKLEVPGVEKMLDHVVYSSEQFSFQMCLRSGDGSRTFRNWGHGVPDSWCHDSECFGLEVDPCDGWTQGEGMMLGLNKE